jgi:hypothetical protein
MYQIVFGFMKILRGEVIFSQNSTLEITRTLDEAGITALRLPTAALRRLYALYDHSVTAVPLLFVQQECT